MFTGIVKEIGLIKGKTHGSSGGVTLKILSKSIKPHLGDSVVVTARARRAKAFQAKLLKLMLFLKL